MEQQEKSKERLRQHLTAGQAARHCSVTVPALKRWIRAGRLRAFRTPGGHTRIELEEFQRFLQRYGMPVYPVAPQTARVLIVDDEPEIVELLAERLSADPRGFALETATDGYEALVKVGSFKPTILILDVVMPRLDGIEVCRRLKAVPETQDIKILGITGYPETVPRLLAAGADACLTKPLDLQQVQQEVERLLGEASSGERGRGDRG